MVVPIGLISAITGRPLPPNTESVDNQAVAAMAREIVMEIERQLGFDPLDREPEKLGYDIESRVPGTGKLRFIEVKGRRSDADTVTVTKNEILYSLNKPEDFILAIVEFHSAETYTGSLCASPLSPRARFRSYQCQLRLLGLAGAGRRTVVKRTGADEVADLSPTSPIAQTVFCGSKVTAELCLGCRTCS